MSPGPWLAMSVTRVGSLIVGVHIVASDAGGPIVILGGALLGLFVASLEWDR